MIKQEEVPHLHRRHPLHSMVLLQLGRHLCTQPSPVLSAPPAYRNVHYTHREREDNGLQLTCTLAGLTLNCDTNSNSFWDCLLPKTRKMTAHPPLYLKPHPPEAPPPPHTWNPTHLQLGRLWESSLACVSVLLLCDGFLLVQVLGPHSYQTIVTAIVRLL